MLPKEFAALERLVTAVELLAEKTVGQEVEVEVEKIIKVADETKISELNSEIAKLRVELERAGTRKPVVMP